MCIDNVKERKKLIFNQNRKYRISICYTNTHTHTHAYNTATQNSKSPWVRRAYLNGPGVGPNKPPPCLLAARDGAKPNSF